MRKFWSTLLVVLMTASLAACGGDSGAFTTPATSSGATTATVAKLTVASSVANLPPDGTTATITVTAQNASNVAVDGATVTFATSSGNIAVTSGTTDANGHATATLSAQGVTAGTTITVTAMSGTVSGKTTVTVANTQQTLSLTTNAPQIPSAPGGSATIKALLTAANNNVVSGATVAFTADSGAITVTQGTTDSNGVAVATLIAGTSQQNRTITVTATSGGSSAKIQVAVIGTSLALSGPTSLVQSVPGTYTVTLQDSGGNPIAGQPIAVSSVNNNTLSAATVTTSGLGTATFTVTGVNSGTDTILATAYGGSLTANQLLSVSNQAFAITAPALNAQIPVGAANAVPVTINWAASGALQSGTVNFSSSRGTISPTTVTVTNGVPAQPVTLYSTSAGNATVSATAVQGGNNVASATQQVAFYAPVSTATAVSVQANPSRVATQGQSTIVATVVDANGNPVENATVNFTLTDTTGGNLSGGGSAVTNTSGQASVTYTGGATSSQTNGVAIGVQVLGTSITNSTTLTVGGQTVFLSLGTGNQLTQPSLTQNEWPWSVQASDASGAGINGVTVTFSVQTTAYLTGSMSYANGEWSPNYAAGPCGPATVYEYNGTIESPPPTPVPSNYVQTLIPGMVVTTDVSSAVTGQPAAGSNTTPPTGSAIVNLIYPKDHSRWVVVALTATATVSGTQNSTTSTFLLLGLASDYTTLTISPPGQVSPYGVAAQCYPSVQ